MEHRRGPVAPTPDERIARRASAQQGLITRAQLVADGLSPGAIQRRRASGRLLDLHRGVYLVGGSPRTRRVDLLASCLAAGPGAAVSHRAAAQVWGAWGGATPTEISTARESAHDLAGVVLHRSRDLAVDHTTVVDGMPVTTPVRVLVDLGQVATWQTVRSVMDRLLAKKLVTPEAIEAGLAMHSRRGRRGIGDLRRAVASAGLVANPDASVLARMFARVCSDAGLPPPAVEHEVVVDGHRRRIDFAFPDRMLAVEIDGYEFHGSPTAFESDRVRGNELALHGWTVLHFTWQQIVHRPEHVVQVMRRAL